MPFDVLHQIPLLCLLLELMCHGICCMHWHLAQLKQISAGDFFLEMSLSAVVHLGVFYWFLQVAHCESTVAQLDRMLHATDVSGQDGFPYEVRVEDSAARRLQPQFPDIEV